MEPTGTHRTGPRHDAHPEHPQGHGGGAHRADGGAHRADSGAHRADGGDAAPAARIRRFAAEYGWWRVVAIPVMSIITVWMLIDVVAGGDGADVADGVVGAETGAVTGTGEGDSDKAGSDSAAADGAAGPDPANAHALELAVEQLPPGGPYAESGDGTYRVVGQPGMEAGEGTERVIRYTVEVENGVNTTAYGGDSAFAAMIDATLSDPRGWTEDSRFKFVHVDADDDADTRIRLTSLATTAEICGDVLAMETSCHTSVTGESLVVLNESRWVRGAQPFEGDLGNYRQYMINHEVGHAIGYGTHQACGGEGQLAPIMMQQTIELNNAKIAELSPNDVYDGEEDVTCEPNPWPYPTPATTDVHDPQAE